MCTANMTNLEDGSNECPIVVLPGTSLAARYAVIVSFGVFLNGTSLTTTSRTRSVPAGSVPVVCPAAGLLGELGT